MNEKLRQAMKRLGYRHMGKGAWGKPVAYHLFLIKMKGKVAEFTNYFRGANDKIYVFNSHTIEDTDNSGGYEHSIKFAEYDTRTDVGGTGRSDFGFITPEDVFSDLI